MKSYKILSFEHIVNLPKTTFPLLTVSDNKRSIFSKIIKDQTDGRWNHAMWLLNSRCFVTQGIIYKTRKTRDFMDKKHRLKFWHNPDWTSEDKAKLVKYMQVRLNEGLLKRSYDVLGVFGQLIKVRKIQSPWTQYCSETVGNALRLVEPEFNLMFPTPVGINEWCKAHSQMECYGVYDAKYLRY